MRRALLILCLLFAPFAAWAASPAPLKPSWEPGVYDLGGLVPLSVEVPVSSPAFYLEGDLSEGADWGPSARIARITQEAPPSFPGTLKLRVVVQIFAVGDVRLAPLAVTLRTAASSQTFALEPPPIHVTAILPAWDQPKPPPAAPLPVPAGFPVGWVILGAAALALAVLALAAAVRRLRSRRKAPAAAPGLRETDPDRWAREEASKILRSRAPAVEKYGALSELLRDYLEIKLGDPFLEWTTSEVHEGCGRHGVLQGQPTTDLLGVLSLCDWVQFARHEPTQEEERRTEERVLAVLAALSRPPEQEKAS